jgi:hypothetical protein
MSNGRNPRGRKHVDANRDAGGFAALPWSVLDSPAYLDLSHPARSLLLEFARQHIPGRNGQLLASKTYLRRRGWRSADVITRAKRELLKSGFIHETVMGRRPNRASWYGLTWFSLEQHRDYDEGAFESFVRSAYRKSRPAMNTMALPRRGTDEGTTAPARGQLRGAYGAPDGAVRLHSTMHAAPAPGNLSDIAICTGNAEGIALLH